MSQKRAGFGGIQAEALTSNLAVPWLESRRLIREQVSTTPQVESSRSLEFLWALQPLPRPGINWLETVTGVGYAFDNILLYTGRHCGGRPRAATT